jgi:SAM-dependent methyltransferase
MGEEMNVTSICNLFACPDDGAALVTSNIRSLECPACHRSFPVHDGKLVELLPSAPSPVVADGEYLNGYHQAFSRKFRRNPEARAWGAPESHPREWVRRRTRQVDFVGGLVESAGNAVLCDVSAGAGYYTRAYAARFNVVLHCDLSVDNLSYNLEKLEKGKHDNIIFVRADYFRLPLRSCVDRLLCFDTLIQGPQHEATLLASIAGALRPDGFALLDFHNWYHNPLRRIGLMPENFTPGSYGRRAAAELVAKAGAGRTAYFPFRQEFEPGSLAGRLLGPLIPPTRHIFRMSACA